MGIDKKKLLVVIQGNVGGAERIAVTVTKGLDPNKYEVVYYLVGMTNDNKFPIEDFIPNHWKVCHIKKAHSAILSLNLLRTLIKEQPDTVFSTTLYINGKLLLFRSLFSSIKFIVRCENYLYTFKKRQQKLIKSTYKKANLIIAQTEEMKQELINQLHFSDDKVAILHNPLDTKSIDNNITNGLNPYPADDTIKFCACGKLAHQKGFDLLIEAFAEAKKTYDNAHLFIVGKNDGPNKDYFEILKIKAKSLDIINNITFVGYQSNPYVYLKYADCFVLSSRWEGLPNVMLESLYLGTPVAAFKCIPIIERIINDSKNGFLAEKEDIQSLSKAMIHACSLGRIQTTYKSSSVEDFYYIFENAKKPMIKMYFERGIDIYRKIRDKYLYLRRYPYLKRIEKYLDRSTSIISSNCLAGRIMQDNSMEYNTPTLGLWFMPDDFSKFCSNIEYYLHCDIIEKKHSKNDLGEYKRTHRLKHPYPVGSLGEDVEIHFLHYYTFEEAASKFKRRAGRVNLNNMIMIASEQNGCTEDDIKAFDAIPFRRKLIFCSKPYPYKSVVYIKEFNQLGHAGDPYKQGHIYYKYLAKWLEQNS